jgi:hypothetical protein
VCRFGAGCEAGGSVRGGMFGRGAEATGRMSWVSGMRSGVCGAWAGVGVGLGEWEKAGSSRRSE